MSAREFSFHFDHLHSLPFSIFSLSHARPSMMFLARIRKVMALLSDTRSLSSERSSRLTTTTAPPPLPIAMSGGGTLSIGTRGSAWTHLPQRRRQQQPRVLSRLTRRRRRRRFARLLVSSGLRRRGIRRRCRRRRSASHCRAPFVPSHLLAATDSGVI